MIAAKARKWGGSFGLLVKREDAEKLNIRDGEEVFVEIRKKDNPLKELWGWGKGKTKLTAREAIGHTRRELRMD